MKKFFAICLMTLLALSCSMPSVADADAFSLYLISLVELKSDFMPHPINTFEDVDPITNIRPDFTGTGPIIRHSTLMSVYNGAAIPQSAGEALINKINSTNGMILSNGPSTLLSFLLSGRFYLDHGGFDKFGIWQEKKTSTFPYNYTDTADPHIRHFFLCLHGGFKYIRSFSLPPNAKSCNHNRSLCSYPPCQKEEKEDDDENGNGIPNEVITPENHPPHAPFNMYYKLGKIIEDNFLSTASGVKENESDITFTVNFKDRTPPIILGSSGGNFPEIGTSTPATTGDWYKVEGLKIEDNHTAKIGTALAIGKIDTSPSMTWKSEENWKFEAPRIINSGEESDYIILPNSCHGVMRYSVFAWDENGLVNPGEPMIASDSPEICYGLRKPPFGFEDLLRHPLDAKPWPITIDFASSNNPSYINANLNPGNRRGEGLVHIRDNDLPNILIRIESVKDKSRIFFPPVIPPGELTIIPSSEYKKGLGLPNANANDYQQFLGPLPGIPYTQALMQDTANPLYFSIIQVLHPDLMELSDRALLQKFAPPMEQEFIRKHFRLEDYMESDNLASTGAPDTSENNFGKRCGIGQSITAILELPDRRALIQEDVEYLIDVWADDNVKWATIDSGGAVLDNIIAVPTGIVAGRMVVDIPNQHPPARHEVVFDTNEAVNGKLRVVFREPTPNVGSSLTDMTNGKFPSIDVRVTDYAGLERHIKLYLRITNENPNIRIIDRKHGKND